MQSQRNDSPSEPLPAPDGGPPSAERETASSAEDELEQSLSILDSLAPSDEEEPEEARSPARSNSPVPDGTAPNAVSEDREEAPHPEFDFGDLSDVEALSTATEIPAIEPTGEQAADTPPASTETAEPVELDLAGSAGPETHVAEADVAAEQLQRRIHDLLEEANARYAAGRPDDALAVLSRVFILDEENAEARTLEEKIRSEAGHAAREMDDRITEAVQMIESGRLEEAKNILGQVLQQCPHHVEVQGYLEQIEKRLAAQGSGQEQEQPAPTEEGADVAPSPQNAESADPVEAIPLASTPTDRVPDPSQLHHGPEETPDLSLPELQAQPSATVHGLPRWTLYAAGALVLAAAGAWILLHRGGGEDVSAASGAEGAPARVAGATKAGVDGHKTATTPAGAPDTRTPEEKARALREAASRAQQAFENRDFAAAVIAYSEVLELDPENEEAIAGLTEAGQRYKEQRAAAEQLERAKAAFRDGEYRAALRMFYRLSPEASGPEVERYKVNGWYDLGMVALRAGNCKTAAERFREALAIAPDDPGVRQGLDLAERYQKDLKDLAFYRAVDRLGFRDLEGNTPGS